MRLEQTIYKALKVVNGDTYLLSLVVAKRAEQISNGDQPLVEVPKDSLYYKPSDIAIMELAEDKLDYKIV
jgi:DNA-directed RNA polymerase subunit omega